MIKKNEEIRAKELQFSRFFVLTTPVSFFFTRNTFPKEPRPITLSFVKSFKVTEVATATNPASAPARLRFEDNAGEGVEEGVDEGVDKEAEVAEEAEEAEDEELVDEMDVFGVALEVFGFRALDTASTQR